MNFQVGDVVKLKSNSIEMVVQIIGSGGLINCIWYSRTDDKYKTFDFYPQTLEKINQS